MPWFKPVSYTHLDVYKRQAKEVVNLTSKEKEILSIFKKLVPLLSDREKDGLLDFGEGMAFLKTKQNEEIKKQKPA